MKERSMRRKDRAVSRDEALGILVAGEYGVLASADKNGQPYGVPLSYWVSGENIYFHCARKGHKIENIRANPKVSFTVVGKVQAVYDKNFTTCFESVIVFGKVGEVVDRDEKFSALYGLAEKYLPEHLDKAADAISDSFDRTAVYAMTLTEISGKAKKERRPL
ncbi:pyridoxamine 5'-phosphate oxidase family protein [Desulfosarcina sp. OttesenSCG-928-A07]|nr:pyridoxamine 5'-phosphate oxidase family protein [Desulfosarcina sp. OttesenSCG-928-A07]